MGLKVYLPLENILCRKVVTPGFGIDYKHLKVENYGAPPIDELDDAVDYIEDEIKNVKPVLVHCNGGSARTGTLLAAYIMKKEGISAAPSNSKSEES
jgi:atypical dual specificity phosphatase